MHPSQGGKRVLILFYENFFNALGQIEIFLGHPSGIMGAQRHLQGVVDVSPIGMVVHPLTFKGNPGHGGKGLPEILEGEGFGDAALVIGPARELFQGGHNLCFYRLFHGPCFSCSYGILREWPWPPIPVPGGPRSPGSRCARFRAVGCPWAGPPDNGPRWWYIRF